MFRLNLLGALDLRDSEGQPVRSVLAQPKRLAVLAYLALHEGYCRRDSILPVFWPETDQEHARAALRKMIYNLRQSLGDQAIVGRGDEEIAFGDSVLSCDAREMRGALTRGDAQAAIDLYRGDLLPGFFLSEVPDFECWLDKERERFRLDATRLTDSLTKSCDAAGDIESALVWARRRFELFPTDESGVRLLLCLLERTGDRSGAISAFEHFSVQLRLTYDLEPSPETVALIDRVRTAGDTNAVQNSETRAPLGTTNQPLEIAAISSGLRTGDRAEQRRRRRLPYLFLPPWRQGVILASFILPALLLLRAPILSLIQSAFGGLTQPAEAATEEMSIAVLPIDEVGEGSDEYLGVGMTDELINALGRVNGLRVASRTSTFALKEQGSDVQAIGLKLKVRYIIEGSLRREGDRLRLTIQLIDVADGQQRWAQRYDREMSDVLAMQEEVSGSIVAALRGPLALNAMPHQLRGTRSPEAYDQYLRGRFLLEHDTPESVESAIRHFSNALQNDSAYSLAYAGLADSYLAQSEWKSPGSVLPQAKAAAVRALSLNEDLHETHLALARLLHQFDWNWRGAEKEFKRALELAPELPSLHYEYANYLAASRRFDEMLAEVRKGLDLERREALDPVAFLVSERERLAQTLFKARRYSEAIAMAESALELDPRSRARASIMYSSLMLGDMKRAEAEMRRLDQGNQRQFVRAGMYARAGRPQESRVVLDSILQRARVEYVAKDQIGGVYLALGDTTEALRWYEAALNERHWWMVFTNSDPLLEGFRSNPRFQRLLRQMNAPS